MKALRTLSLALAIVAPGLTAQAGSIDFNVLPGPAGFIRYDGDGGPLLAGSLDTPEVVGQGTPAHDGQVFALAPGTALSFATGDFLRMLPNGWEFAGGGGITIGAPSALAGTFSGPVDVIDTGDGVFKVVAAAILARVGPDVAAFYGFPGDVPLDGGVAILFESPAKPGGAIESRRVDSGNVAVTVPEPGSLRLAVVGLVVLVSLRYFRQTRPEFARL